MRLRVKEATKVPYDIVYDIEQISFPDTEGDNMKSVVMTTTCARRSGPARRVTIRDIAQGTDTDMIAEARKKCQKYLKLFERPQSFDIVIDPCAANCSA